ncbi:MAG: hypothetical protein AB1656_15200 [Candidatus Omnitrophota bacterium]
MARSNFSSLFIERSLAVLSHKNLPLGVSLFAVLLASPLIYTGWFADDLLQRCAYLDTPAANEFLPKEDRLGGPMRMYSFFDGNKERKQRYLDKGGFPWWIDLDILACFWRPFTALLSMADYRLWPQSSVLMHIHSLGWFAALLFIANAHYRRIMGPGWAAGLALLLFAVNDIQAVPISFLANRHILLGAVFGALTLLAHSRWRERKQVRWAFAACLFLLFSLLSSESGVAVFAYLFSYSLWIERGAIRARIATLVPYILLILAWRIVYVSLGYGISGIDLYVDPGREPVRFAYKVMERLPILLLGVLAFPPSDIYIILTPFAMPIYWLFAAAALSILSLVFFPLWKNCRLSCYWLCGTVLSAIPLCAAIPGGRSMLLASLGAMGLLAQTARNFEWKKKLSGYPFQKKNLTLGILTLALFLRWADGAAALTQNGKMFNYAQKGIDVFSNIGVHDPGLAKQDLIVVNPPMALIVAYLIPLRLLDDESIPAHIRVLSPSLESIEVRRIDEYALAVRPQYGFMSPPRWHKGNWTEWRTYIDFPNAIKRFEQLIMSSHRPMSVGEKIRLTGLTIEITELTEDNRPAEAAYRFDVPLEDASLRWLQWNNKRWRYEEFIPPSIGRSVWLN